MRRRKGSSAVSISPALASGDTASRIAARFGLVNTMVFTHLPSDILLAAVAFAPTLPIACLFIFLQRYFIKGLTAGAAKG